MALNDDQLSTIDVCRGPTNSVVWKRTHDFWCLKRTHDIDGVADKFIPREVGRKIGNKGSTHETNKYTAFTDGNKKIICYRVQ